MCSLELRAESGYTATRKRSLFFRDQYIAVVILSMREESDGPLTTPRIWNPRAPCFLVSRRATRETLCSGKGESEEPQIRRELRPYMDYSRESINLYRYAS
jgi:hypothetical protein